MAQEIVVTDEYNVGLYDRATDNPCETEKVVDVTEDVGGQDRLVLMYTRDSNGRIVQLCSPYDGEVIMGSKIHFPVDRLDTWMNMEPKDDTFGSWASRYAVGKEALANLIHEHAPPQ